MRSIPLCTALFVSSMLVGAVYGTLGDRDQAFRWLEAAFAEHDQHRVDPGRRPPLAVRDREIQRRAMPAAKELREIRGGQLDRRSGTPHEELAPRDGLEPPT